MIAHIDVDSFFAAVIVRKNPSLKGKPLLALGMGGGCVIAASYEAKACGVKTGMPLKEALPLVPHAVRVQSDFHEAALASNEIENILTERCAVMEQMSIDEWFLDLKTLVGGMPDNPLLWAKATQQMIREKTALTVSVGVGPTKLLAKMASEYKKPAGITFLQRQNSKSETNSNLNNSLNSPNTVSSFGLLISDFLRNRPAAAIPGIGRRRDVHAQKEGWVTAWDIAQAPAERLIALFGRPGYDLKRELLGERLFDVTAEEDPPKSISRCRSFRPTRERDYIWAQLLKHAEYTVMKMRRHELACRGISVWVRDGEYNGESANASLPQAMHTTDALLPYVQACFERSFDARVTYTQVALALWRLVKMGTPQYSLFIAPQMTERDEAIQKSLDTLHERFGRNSITRGAALKVKSGTKVTIDMPIYEGV